MGSLIDKPVVICDIAGVEQSMSETDIYKSREEAPTTSVDPRFRKGRRRRSSSHLQTFEEKDRRRRSKNSGVRRLLHLSRKSENEKIFWWGLLVLVVVLLVSAALWQFWFAERTVRRNPEEDEYRPPAQSIPAADSAAE